MFCILYFLTVYRGGWGIKGNRQYTGNTQVLHRNVHTAWGKQFLVLRGMGGGGVATEVVIVAVNE